MDFSISLFIVSFIAGITTVFAPCVFTFLPVILGSTTVDAKTKYKKSLTIIGSLAVSVFIFTLILKASTLLIDVPPQTWDILAGIIILTQGILILFPESFDRISKFLRLTRSVDSLEKARKYNGVVGDVLVGFSLGPIFSSCSPTYGFIIGSLFISTFSVSLIYLITYIAGLSLMLFAVSYAGQNFVKDFKWGINPKGFSKRIIGAVFIILGILIATGIYKDIEACIIENFPFIDVTRIDKMLLDGAKN